MVQGTWNSNDRLRIVYALPGAWLRYRQGRKEGAGVVWVGIGAKIDCRGSEGPNKNGRFAVPAFQGVIFNVLQM